MIKFYFYFTILVIFYVIVLVLVCMEDDYFNKMSDEVDKMIPLKMKIAANFLQLRR